MKSAFVNAEIFPIEGDVIENGTLIIENEKIVAVGSDLSTDGCKVIDCSGKVITPGFIDPHSHVGLFQEAVSSGSAASSDGNEQTDSITPYLRSMDAIFPEDMGFDDARRGGVTTMGITHGSSNAIGGQVCCIKSKGIVVDDMVIREPAGVKFALGENPKGSGMRNKRVPQTRMAIAYIIRKAFYEAIDYGQTWEDYNTKVELAKEDPEKKDPIPRPAYDMGKEVLLKLLRGEIPARCHSHRADDIRTAIRLADEFGFRLVIDHATESFKIKDVILEKGLPVVVGPSFGARTKSELINKSLTTPGIMMKAGAMVSITTDAPVIPIDGLRDVVVMAIREGLPKERALETITINPAKVLEVDQRVGSLKAGKDADFLIFNGDPFDIKNRVLKTYIDGELVYEYTE